MLVAQNPIAQAQTWQQYRQPTRSLNALSLRELAREAGLNPNTFYRHFKDFDELGMAIIEEMSREIRQPLRALPCSRC